MVGLLLVITEKLYEHEKVTFKHEDGVVFIDWIYPIVREYDIVRNWQEERVSFFNKHNLDYKEFEIYKSVRYLNKETIDKLIVKI